MTLKLLKVLKEYLFPTGGTRFVREAPLFDALNEEIEMEERKLQTSGVGGSTVLKCFCNPKGNGGGMNFNHIEPCPLAKKEGGKLLTHEQLLSHRNKICDCFKEEVKKPTWEIRRVGETYNSLINEALKYGWEPFATGNEFIYFRRLKT